MTLNPQLNAPLICLLGALLAPAVLAAERSLVLEPGQNLRALAAEHLGDAELWQEWLRANDLESAAAVRPGMRLRFPEQALIDAQQALARSAALIERANRLSARIFAAAAIGRAVHLHNQALEAREGARWPAALKLARQAETEAKRAVAQCEAQQDVAAEAALAEREGGVERRGAGDVVWKTAPVDSLLVEGDRLRTLENAFAVLLFRDQSRLRMDENSQLLIKRMRSNLLEKREQAQVSLISGDLFALLGANKARSAFDVELPGVELDGDSRDFFVRRDKQTTKVANYQGNLELASDQQRLTLEENEGVAVSEAGFTDKRALLPPPEGLHPAAGELFYRLPLDLAWAPVEAAGSYWVEISDDPGFQKVRRTETVTDAAELQLEDLPEGAYFWRVIAVDDAGFPGPRSAAAGFSLIFDRQPPLLAVRRPAADARVRTTPLEIRGLTEAGARLTLNGEPVTLEGDGDFTLSLGLQRGENTLIFQAMDAAGNTAEVQRRVTYAPEPDLFLAPDPEMPGDYAAGFFSRGTVFTWRGTSLPRAAIEATDDQGKALAAATADAQGRFSLNLPASGPEGRAVTLRLTSPSGQTLEQALRLHLRAEPPQISLDPEPPRLTQAPSLLLRGQAKGASLLAINGEPAALQEEGFEQALTLAPGPNRILIEACDRARNCTRTERLTTYDLAPPQWLDHKLEVAADGNTVLVSVQAADDSGLARAAEFELVADDFQYRGHLRLSGAGLYFGIVALPPGVAPPGRLQRVILRDSMGNRLEWRPDPAAPPRSANQ